MFKKLLPIILITILGISIYLMTQKTENVKISYKEDTSFRLNTQDGVITNKQFLGKSVVLYFGFMNCPDICPTTLFDIQKSFEQLSPQEVKNTQVIFVSVDPSRDKVKALKEYVQYFHPSFIGATADETVLKDMANRYHADYRYEELENSALDYTVEHTTRIYLLDTKGKLSKMLSTHNIETQQITQAIKTALEE
jgi:protein SCO1/2